ncbi:hypothetical protein V5O48_017618, partial [Marasmius crinis-equi]
MIVLLLPRGVKITLPLHILIALTPPLSLHVKNPLFPLIHFKVAPMLLNRPGNHHGLGRIVILLLPSHIQTVLLPLMVMLATPNPLFDTPAPFHPVIPLTTTVQIQTAQIVTLVSFRTRNFQTRFSWDQFNGNILRELKVEWSYSTTNGRKAAGSSVDADKPSHGLRSYRYCLGVLRCNNKECHIHVRPKVDPKARREQIGKLCQCNKLNGATDFRLELVDCNNIAKIIKWKDGVDYQNGVRHNHPPFHHQKRLTPLQAKAAEDLVKANPTATPAALRSGNTVSGGSLIKISTRFVTEDVARDVVRNIRGPKPVSGDLFVDRLTKIQQDHPRWNIRSHFENGVAVISCQSPWMAERFDESNNGITGFSGSVTDGAHGWFEVFTSILITTSVFSFITHCWVPGLFSYSNG